MRVSTCSNETLTQLHPFARRRTSCFSSRTSSATSSSYHTAGMARVRASRRKAASSRTRRPRLITCSSASASTSLRGEVLSRATPTLTWRSPALATAQGHRHEQVGGVWAVARWCGGFVAGGRESHGVPHGAVREHLPIHPRAGPLPAAAHWQRHRPRQQATELDHQVVVEGVRRIALLASAAQDRACIQHTA